MIGIPVPKIRLEVIMKGRKVRTRTVSAASVEALHAGPENLRHSFKDDNAALALKADLRSSGAPTVVAQLSTLLDRRQVDGQDGTSAWEYRDRHRDGTESHCMPDEEVKDSFTGLQLDVSHALWGLR